MPVYILIVDDCNGHSEIVAFWLAALEDRTTIKQMANLGVRPTSVPTRFVTQLHAKIKETERRAEMYAVFVASRIIRQMSDF